MAHHPPLLVCQSLAMRFGGLRAVNNLSFTVSEGAIHGLIGPNGAGKTTVFNIISGYYAPTDGKVLFRGENIAGLKMHAVARRGLVRTFQHSSLFNEMSVLENVLIGLSAKPTLTAALLANNASERTENIKQAEALLAFFNLSAHRDATAAELPHGLQRTLGIAVAMAAKPTLLMLDEPFTGMNPEETRRMMELTEKVRNNGITILLVEHDMRAVMGLCDKITVINFGEMLAEGTADEIANHPRVIEAYLGGGKKRHE